MMMSQDLCLILIPINSHKCSLFRSVKVKDMTSQQKTEAWVKSIRTVPPGQQTQQRVQVSQQQVVRAPMQMQMVRGPVQIVQTSPGGQTLIRAGGQLIRGQMVRGIGGQQVIRIPAPVSRAGVPIIRTGGQMIRAQGQMVQGQMVRAPVRVAPRPPVPSSDAIIILSDDDDDDVATGQVDGASDPRENRHSQKDTENNKSWETDSVSSSDSDLPQVDGAGDKKKDGRKSVSPSDELGDLDLTPSKGKKSQMPHFSVKINPTLPSYGCLN